MNDDKVWDRVGAAPSVPLPGATSLRSATGPTGSNSVKVDQTNGSGVCRSKSRHPARKSNLIKPNQSCADAGCEQFRVNSSAYECIRPFGFFLYGLVKPSPSN